MYVALIMCTMLTGIICYGILGVIFIICECNYHLTIMTAGTARPHIIEMLHT